jgi:hypothetical protein
MSAPRPAGPRRDGDNPKSTSARRCPCPNCLPAIPLGRLRDDPELAAATVRAAWAARVALARWRATRGGRP